MGHSDGYADVTALVTGAAGFVGSHLAASLLAGGATVVGVDNAWERPDRPPAVDPGSGLPMVYPAPSRRCDMDLRTAELEGVVAGADVVFHLAGMPGVWPSWTQFDDYLRSNVSVTKRLVDACLAARVPRLVIASSSSVYGEEVSGPVTEERTPRPISPYAVTKLAAEQLALAYSARPDAALTVIVLRYFTVFGPRQRPDMLISRAVRAALDGTPIKIYGDGTHRRDFVYVGDVVRANLLAMRAQVDSQVFNVGSGCNVSVREVLDLIGELAGSPIDAWYSERRPGDVRATHAGIDRATRLLAYRPETDLRRGLAAQLAAERAVRSQGATRTAVAAVRHAAPVGGAATGPGS